MSKRFVTAVLWGCFAVVIAGFVCEYSIHLAGARIYRQDECRNVCAAYFLATGQGTTSGTPVSLFLLPLMWLARGATHSVDLYASARFFSTELFWLNVVLLSVAAAGKLFSRKGVVALAGAATLAPLWDFGFEIRPENLILAGLLLMWCLLRVRPEGLQSYFVAGLLAAAIQFVHINSLAYSLPISLAAIIFPPTGLRGARGKLALAWVAGAAVAFLLVRIGYGAAGLWSVYVRNWHHSLSVTDEGAVDWWRFPIRLAVQTPLVLAIAAAALASLIADARRRGTEAFSWDGVMPEGMLLALAVAVLALNRTRSPHELLYPVAFAFLLAARYLSMLWKGIAAQPATFGLIAAVVVFGHLVPFELAARRHLDATNYHQERLINLAEQMTEPGKDLVYDSVGMVPTRRSAEYELFFQERNNGNSKASLSELLRARLPAVIIADSRFDQLSEADKEFIRQRYVAIAGDFWTLGKMLPEGGGDFEVLQAGRYHITSAEASNLLGTYPRPENLAESLAPEPKFPPLSGTLDGVPLSGKPVELAAGKHHLECAADTAVAIVWLGPKLDSIDRITGGERRQLFATSY